MYVGQLPALLQQQAQFFQQTVEQQTNTLAQAMNAMADVVRTLQADRVPVKEKELMTTKRWKRSMVCSVFERVDAQTFLDGKCTSRTG